MTPELFEACMAVYVIATLGFDAWTFVSPVVLCASEYPLFN